MVVYDFIVNYETIAVANILDIHKYLMKKMRQYKIVRLVRQIFVSAMMFFGCKLSNVNPLKCASMSNQECKIKPEIINVNSDEPSFYPYCVKQNTCNGS